MAQLTEAVYDLARLYLRSFCPVAPSFSPTPADSPAAEGRAAREASGTTDHLQFTVFALHGIPAPWISRSAGPRPLGTLLGRGAMGELWVDLSRDRGAECG